MMKKHIRMKTWIAVGTRCHLATRTVAYDLENSQYFKVVFGKSNCKI